MRPKNVMVDQNRTENNLTIKKKMKIEIWSDVVCPFCYIGKKRFDEALLQFKHLDKIDIVWKSYQLNPNQVTNPNQSAIQSLAENKGITLEEAKSMSDYVTDMAKTVGLNYNFDKTITANTFKAHCFAHYAKTKGKQTDAEEALFKAYFIDGLNIDDESTLVNIGKTLGFDETELKNALQNNAFSKEVYQDIYEARQVGVQGVPYFIFNDKYVISGAQDSKTFLRALDQSFEQWQEN